MEIQATIIKQINKKIRKIKNHPKKGVLFYDLNPVMADRELFGQIVDRLAYVVRLMCCSSWTPVNPAPLKVVSIEARGFIWGAAVARELKSSFVPIRKVDNIPHSTIYKCETVSYEYADAEIVLPSACVDIGDNAVIIDDVIATGENALATKKMLEDAGVNVVGAAFILSIDKLNGMKKLGKFSKEAILTV